MFLVLFEEHKKDFFLKYKERKFDWEEIRYLKKLEDPYERDGVLIPHPRLFTGDNPYIWTI